MNTYWNKPILPTLPLNEGSYHKSAEAESGSWGPRIQGSDQVPHFNFPEGKKGKNPPESHIKEQISECAWGLKLVVNTTY